MTEVTCAICGLYMVSPEEPVEGLSREEKQLFLTHRINGAVLGPRINLVGHKNCLQNVNTLVVVPNRARLMEAEKERM